MAKVVLLVEDDFYIRDLYQLAMERKGFTVITAVDGQEAIDLYGQSHPDIVLLDIMLPTMSGLEVLKHIKQLAKDDHDVPVIMITNLDSPEAMERAQNLGADDYWVKSLKPPLEVAEAINKYTVDS